MRDRIDEKHFLTLRVLLEGDIQEAKASALVSRSLLIDELCLVHIILLCSLHFFLQPLVKQNFRAYNDSDTVLDCLSYL